MIIMNRSIPLKKVVELETKHLPYLISEDTTTGRGWIRLQLFDRVLYLLIPRFKRESRRKSPRQEEINGQISIPYIQYLICVDLQTTATRTLRIHLQESNR